MGQIEALGTKISKLFLKHSFCPLLKKIPVFCGPVGTGEPTGAHSAQRVKI